MELSNQVRELYNQFGQRKPMGISAPSLDLPHFFLHRTFWGENDLLIIFNTKRCTYQCYFCQLPAKNSKTFIESKDILAQFMYVMHEMKHSISIFDRLTISNEGSVLDLSTFPLEALLKIAECVHELRRVRTLVLETRLEFLDPKVIKQIKLVIPKVKINILTGFETHDQMIRDNILFKRETLRQFENGLDKVAEDNLELTAYVLYKPSQTMTDDEAFNEANKTIDYLVENTQKRKIKLSIRLNPMYSAEGSRWAKIAKSTPNYHPPKLSDVLKLARIKRREGIEIYIGLSTEGLDDGSNYHSRDDFSQHLLKQAVLFNDKKDTSQTPQDKKMKPVTLQQLVNRGYISGYSNGIIVRTQPNWVVDGESRLSYTTITRLVECCREYHWQIDINTITPLDTLDSICKSFSADFKNPVEIGSEIIITYKVTQVRKRSYELQFIIQSTDKQTVHATINIVSVFFDPKNNLVISPPDSVTKKLTDTLNPEKQEK